MLILIEGIDKSGKSTFIQKLASITSIPVYRKYLPEKIDDKEFHSYFKGIGYATVELNNIFNFDLIIDRSFISDWIYSNRHKDNFSFDIWIEWESKLNLDNSLLIYFSISKETFNKRIQNDPDIYMNESDYERYMSLYAHYIKHTKIPVITINGEIDSGQQIKILQSFIANEDRFRRSTLNEKLSAFS